MIKDELIAKYPDLAADVFNAFAESKRQYVEKLKAGQIEKLTDADKTAKAVMDESPAPIRCLTASSPTARCSRI